MRWSAKPAWWKPWYRYQVANCIMLALNLDWALTHPDNPWGFLNWIGVGAMGALLGANPVIFRLIETVRFMGKAANRQNEAMNVLLQTNAEEIGRSIINGLNSIQRADKPTTRLH